MLTRTHFVKFVERARQLPALPTAFVYPCDAESLQLAVSGAFTGMIAPQLVGPEAKIRDIAGKAAIDIARLPIVDTAAEPRAAAAAAAELAASGRVRAWVRGALGIDDLLAPINASDSPLRGTRRLSHAYFVDLAGWTRGLVLADAQLNITPALAAKRDIVDNTIAFAHVLGIATPRVALLAATDAVSAALPSTGDAAALKALGEQGIFADAYVDGPLTIDTALSGEAAATSGHRSDVAGRADVLIAPSMEAGALVLRTLTGLTSSLAAGVVLGARVPIVAPMKRDSMEVRMASCVLASLVAGAGPKSAERAAAAPSPALAEAAS